MNKTLLLILLIGALLLVTPVAAKEITDKVTDKTINAKHLDSIYLIHTESFGDIEVPEKEYQQVFIGDNITFNTESNWGLYHVLKANGRVIYESY